MRIESVARGKYIHGETHDKGPEASHLVGLDSLPESLIVLGIFALKGIDHQVLVNENLGVESVLLLQLLDLDIVTLGLDAGRRHLAVCVNGSLCDGDALSVCTNGLDVVRVCVVGQWLEEEKGGDLVVRLEEHRGESGLMSLGCIAVSECTYECQLPPRDNHQPTHPHPERLVTRENVQVKRPQALPFLLKLAA